MLLKAKARRHCGFGRAGFTSETTRSSETEARAAAVSVLMSVGSFHRMEQVVFGDVLAGQLGRDDAVPQDEDARARAEQVAFVRRRDDHAEARASLLGDQVVELHAG